MPFKKKLNLFLIRPYKYYNIKYTLLLFLCPYFQFSYTTIEAEIICNDRCNYAYLAIFLYVPLTTVTIDTN